MSQNTETTTTTEVKATVKGVKTAPKKTVKATAPKSAPDKKPAKAPASKKDAPAVREPKYLNPILELLAKNPEGLTKTEIRDALGTTSLSGTLEKFVDFFKPQVIADRRGTVYILTAAGKKAKTVK